MTDVVVFTFAGRRANMELHVPVMKRVLELNPEVQWHIWDLARDRDDSAYLRTISGDRIEVITDFAGENPWERFDDVYRFYTDPMWSDHLFVKTDDDLVFMEATRFAHFVAAIDTNRDRVLSAKVINNGACTFTQPGIQVRLDAMNVRLLDVHMSAEYAEMSHRYFFDHWAAMIAQPLEVLPVQSWVSINCIGYDWAMGCRMAGLIKTRSPRMIAGRRFGHNSLLGDEGLVNTLPRSIVQGFLACHLTFGPQERQMSDHLLADLRKNYAEVGELYLACNEFPQRFIHGHDTADVLRELDRHA